MKTPTVQEEISPIQFDLVGQDALLIKHQKGGVQKLRLGYQSVTSSGKENPDPSIDDPDL